MSITINPQTIKTMEKDGKVEKAVRKNGFLVRDGNEVIGFAKDKKEAEKMASDYKENSAPLANMTFSVEKHKERKRDPKTNEMIAKDGWLLRGSDGKFAKFSENKEDLMKIIKKSGGEKTEKTKENKKKVK